MTKEKIIKNLRNFLIKEGFSNFLIYMDHSWEEYHLNIHFLRDKIVFAYLNRKTTKTNQMTTLELLYDFIDEEILKKLELYILKYKK